MFIALIPKKNKPNSVNDFKPISFFNVCYKVITELLTNRLRPLIDNLIGPEQCGFLP